MGERNCPVNLQDGNIAKIISKEIKELDKGVQKVCKLTITISYKMKKTIDFDTNEEHVASIHFSSRSPKRLTELDADSTGN